MDYEECSFEMIAFGPIFSEQATFEDHAPVRDQMAALEHAVADELRHRGYVVLGTHPPAKVPNGAVLQQILGMMDSKFPSTRP